MSAGIGELAALGTALTWGISNQAQGIVGHKIGSVNITLLRMPFQVLILAAMCLVMQAETHLNLHGFLMLALSGFFGIFLCDFCLFRAMNIIGPATTILIISSSTAFTPVFGWLFLGEGLPWLAVLGIAVTMGGIFVVITEHSGSTLLPGQEVPRGRRLLLGVGLAGVSALTLSLSLITLKRGLMTGLDPLWAAFMRVIVGAALIWGAGFLRGWTRQSISSLRGERKMLGLLVFSCVFIALGMWFASVAMDQAPAGVAGTLIALQPVAVTLVGAIWYRRLPTLRVALGMLVAFGGVALICLR